jgi:arginine/ornithine transport system permease protein
MKFDLVLKHWDLFASGVWVTLHLTALALFFGMLIALPASLSLARRTRFSPLVRGYVYVFRGTPLLVQTYLIYYGLSQFEMVRDSFAWPVLREAWWCALIAFSLNSGAYTAEILRGAIKTRRHGGGPVEAPGHLAGAAALGDAPRLAAIRQRGGLHAARHRGRQRHHHPGHPRGGAHGEREILYPL